MSTNGSDPGSRTPVFTHKKDIGDFLDLTSVRRIYYMQHRRIRRTGVKDFREMPIFLIPDLCATGPSQDKRLLLSVVRLNSTS